MLNHIQITLIYIKLYSSYHHLTIFSMTASFSDCFIPANIVKFPFFDFLIPLEFQHLLCCCLTSVSKILLIFVFVFSFSFILIQVITNSLTISNFKSLQQPADKLPTSIFSFPASICFTCGCVAVYSLRNFRSFPVNSQTHHLNTSLSDSHLPLSYFPFFYKDFIAQ